MTHADKLQGFTMHKKICAIIAAVTIVAAAGIYIVYFHRPPTSDILAANRARNVGTRALNGKDSDYDDYDEEDYDEEDPGDAESSRRIWSKFIRKNNFVSIGELYNQCDGDDKIMLGQVILMADPDSGGIKARVFLNVTFTSPVTGGEMYIECKYNGKDLYSNHWDLCTVEDGQPDKVIFCPISEGHKKYVKDMPIPSYLPKGRYQTKAWLTNQDDDIIGCAYSDFKI